MLTDLRLLIYSLQPYFRSHGLQDDSFLCFGAAWNPFERLNTLIISECHQLTDKFIVSEGFVEIKNS